MRIPKRPAIGEQMAPKKKKPVFAHFQFQKQLGQQFYELCSALERSLTFISSLELLYFLSPSCPQQHSLKMQYLTQLELSTAITKCRRRFNSKQKQLEAFQQMMIAILWGEEVNRIKQLAATKTTKNPMSIIDFFLSYLLAQTLTITSLLQGRLPAYHRSQLFFHKVFSNQQINISVHIFIIKQMPELPQVEIVRRFLEDVLLKPKPKTIKSVKAFYSPIIKEPEAPQFIHALLGQTFTRIHRHGKHLILQLQNYSIISHLRMEGKYLLKDKHFVPEKHDHIQFLLNDGTSLVYNDVRKFGTMHLVKRGQEMNHPSIQKLGPQANNSTTFTPEYLSTICKNSQRSIKELLLDQQVVCGIGNIYADQILFEAGVRPERSGGKVTAKQMRDICQWSKVILENAIEGKGTTIKSFASNHQSGAFQSQLKVYGREHQKCVRCNSSVKKIKLGGRGTHFCPKCQS